MTDDGREGFAPGAEQDDAGDPAAAFEALRRTIEKQGGQIGAEMTIIRRGVEAAFDQFLQGDDAAAGKAAEGHHH